MAKAATCPTRDRYEQLARSGLPAAEKEALLRHIESCDACAQQLSAMPEQEKLVAAIRQAEARGEAPSPEVIDRLVHKLSALRPAAPGAGPDERTLPPRDTAATGMLSFPCPGCGKTLKVKAAAAGKKSKCPHCQAPVQVPGPAEDRTIAPQQSPRAGDGRTLGGQKPGPQGGDTVSPGAAGNRELYDFLAPSQQPDEIGRLGEYRVLKVLGAGGMGVVFLAEDPALKRKLALKAMLPSMAASESARQRFIREAQTAAAIEHDHVVPIFQVSQDRGVPFIAMPFLKGEPLDVRLERVKSLPIAEVLRIGREAAKGLAAAHAAGLVHRDIKPANLWLEGEEGRVKILDFGLARSAADNANLTQQGAIIGTPAYMAPEQAQGGTVDARCDLFSLGCVLYRMSTDQPPFKGNDAVSTLVAVAMENPRPPQELRPEIPEKLSELVMRLLAKNPQERPATATEVVAALQKIEEQTAKGKARPQPRAKKAPDGETMQVEAPRKKRRPEKKRLPVGLLVGGGVLALAALVAAIVLLWPTPKGTVRIESTDPDVVIVFDQTGPTIKGADKEPIVLKAGEHGILIKRGDFTFEADKFVLKKGETVTLKVELLPGKIQLVADGKVIGSRVVPLAPTFKNTIGMEFVLVPRGKSWLGGCIGHPGEKEVEIKEEFYLGKYEVTQEEWGKIMGAIPSHFSRAGGGKDAVKDISDAELKRFPVEMVSWDDAQLFVKELNKRDKAEGWMYCLPTQAEWEYACRGGPMSDKRDSTHEFYFDKPTDQLLPEQANFEHGKGLKRTCKVGSYQPNPLGLYDMHGNVFEWCEDEHKGGDGASQRVQAGGCWDWSGGLCSASFRNACAPSNRSSGVGLRLARVPVGKEVVAPPEKKPETSPTFKNSIGMEFVLVPKGKSWLGGGGGKPGDKEVEIKEEFYLGKYEVTQEEWAKVMESVPSHWSRFGAGKDEVKDISDAELKRFPVELVSWDDAQRFLKELNKRDKQEGWVYRLPTEVEWEYACRGGPMSDRLDSAFDFYLDKPLAQLQLDQANFAPQEGKGLHRTCKVGSYRPNRLGLFDMHGNVWEWCDDVWAKTGEGASQRVNRGGCWFNDSGLSRAAFRYPHLQSARGWHVGLRVARVPIGKGTPPTYKNSIGIEFVLVPKGKSWLGGGGAKLGDKEVEINHDFYLGKYLVTQEEWLKVMGTNPSFFSRDGGGKDMVKDVPDAELKRFPVDGVSWDDTQEFLKEVNRKEKEAGWVYRLPTDDEWEYACRGGPMDERTQSPYHYYFDKPTNELLPNQANFLQKRTCKVGSYKPNRLGLYDMHGNLWEWCDSPERLVDGHPCRPRRGSAFSDPPGNLQANHSSSYLQAGRHNSNGLRVARVPVNSQGTTTPGAVDDAWLRQVATMPPLQQAAAVADKLKELNPGFDGKVEHEIVAGKVVALTVRAVAVRDLSPLRALPELRRLECSGNDWQGDGLFADLSPLRGLKLTQLNCHDTKVADLSLLKGMPLTSLTCYCTPVSDLSPLQGMPLTELSCHHTQIADLSPLRGMKLTQLIFHDTKVADLSPLKGMPLTRLVLLQTRVSDLSPVKGMKLTALDCSYTAVADLAPLEGMPLTYLACGETPASDLSPVKGAPLKIVVCGPSRVADLAPLKGAPLVKLWIDGTKVADLAPLKGIALTELHCTATPVADLSPLKGMPIVQLYCSTTKVTDLSPLKGMPLKDLQCDFVPERDTKVLQSIKGLEIINVKSAADFWKGAGAAVGKPVDDAWIKEVLALPAEKQVQAVADKLKDLNPGFDGKVEREIDAGKVVGLTVSTVAVADLSPLRALPDLRKLACYGAGGDRKGLLADLTPLKGLKLTHLNCDATQVADLSPLKGMPLLDLHLGGTQVADLSALQGMPLLWLHIAESKVSDLAPLRGMKLTQLNCISTQVADLSPLKGMPLQYIECGNTPVSDLAPLKGAPLNTVYCGNTRVSDLAALKGLPLARLGVFGTAVADLSPLKGMPLTHLNCDGTQVADLSPLKGMPLQYIDCSNTPVSDLAPLQGALLNTVHCGNTRVSELSALKGLPLTQLTCFSTTVADLAPLKGMPLTHLNFDDTRVSDLSPLRDMKLTNLWCRRTKVSDLTLLKGMPLTYLAFDFKPERDTAILRGIKTLEKINEKPAAEFLKEAEAKSKSP
jgi:formylglycine-generating enzyme required for sulfatase activity/Leucine-rich repeat (LRR) protein